MRREIFVAKIANLCRLLKFLLSKKARRKSMVYISIKPINKQIKKI